MDMELVIQKLDNRPEGYVVFGPPAAHGEVFETVAGAPTPVVMEAPLRFPRPKLTITPEMWESLGRPTSLLVDLTVPQEVHA